MNSKLASQIQISKFLVPSSPLPNFFLSRKCSNRKRSRCITLESRSNNQIRRSLMCERNRSISVSSVDLREKNAFLMENGNPEPPWLVVPPRNVDKTSTREIRPSIGFTSLEIPFSLRILKMKRRLSTSRLETENRTPDSSIEKAIVSVVLMIEELQKALFSEDHQSENFDAICRETNESYACLFEKVFSVSPNFIVWLLILTANFVSFSTDKLTKTYTSYEESKIFSSSMSVKQTKSAGCFRQVNQMTNLITKSINYEQNPTTIKLRLGTYCDEEQMVAGTRQMYEKLIADEPDNSLILSNYAQFLYLIASSPDRAEEMFRRAAKAQPPDAEAISRYAIFLWQARGELEAAESAFLEAIDLDPGNYYHNSNYAFFLWRTGGVETCFPTP